MDLMEAFGSVYFVMEYLDGQTVKEYVQDKGPMDMFSVKTMILQLLGALENVHRKHILHRDIKPHNIFITSSGRPVLIDFGSARQQFANVSQTLTTILTPGYAPVEQYSRQGQQGAWTDIYALAATSYFMLTGSAPPEAQDIMLGYEKLVPPSQRRPDICEVEEEWLLQGLRIQKTERPQSVKIWRKLILPYEVSVLPPPPLNHLNLTRIQTGSLANILPDSFTVQNNAQKVQEKKRKYLLIWGSVFLASAIVFMIYLFWGRSFLSGANPFEKEKLAYSLVFTPPKLDSGCDLRGENA